MTMTVDPRSLLEEMPDLYKAQQLLLKALQNYRITVFTFSETFFTNQILRALISFWSGMKKAIIYLDFSYTLQDLERELRWNEDSSTILYTYQTFLYRLMNPRSREKFKFICLFDFDTLLSKNKVLAYAILARSLIKAKKLIIYSRYPILEFAKLGWKVFFDAAYYGVEDFEDLELAPPPQELDSDTKKNLLLSMLFHRWLTRKQILSLTATLDPRMDTENVLEHLLEAKLLTKNGGRCTTSILGEAELKKALGPPIALAQLALRKSEAVCPRQTQNLQKPGRKPIPKNFCGECHYWSKVHKLCYKTGIACESNKSACKLFHLKRRDRFVKLRIKDGYYLCKLCGYSFSKTLPAVCPSCYSLYQFNAHSRRIKAHFSGVVSRGVGRGN